MIIACAVPNQTQPVLQENHARTPRTAPLAAQWRPAARPSAYRHGVLLCTAEFYLTPPWSVLNQGRRIKPPPVPVAVWEISGATNTLDRYEATPLLIKAERTGT